MHANLRNLKDLYEEQLPLNNAEPVMLYLYYWLTLQVHADLSDFKDLCGEQLLLRNKKWLKGE